MLPRGLSLVLSALLVAMPVAGVTAADESSAAANAVLSIASDPAGASVYVDGLFVGETPLNLDRLAAGDHRVRVVKNGFLENGRIVNIGAGRTTAVQVKLTPNDNASNAQVTTTGGGSKKWLWIGLAGGGAAAAALVLMNRNKSPNAGTISVSPTATGMAGITTYTFRSEGANDPDDDPLTYNWNFGDGTSGTGATVTKVYSAAGSNTVTLTVSDGKESVTAPTLNVTVARNMAGAWTGGFLSGWEANVTLNLTQNGIAIGGTMTFSGGLVGPPLPLTASNVATTSYPTAVTVQANYTVSEFDGGFNARFTGTVDATGNTMTGTCFDLSDFYDDFENACTFRR
jgi:PKD repeat protein